MKPLLAVTAMIILAGCASGTSSDPSGSVDRTQPMVVGCSDGLAKCYSQANELCGARGFDELERTRDSQLTAAGRLERQSDDRHVYREDVRFEDGLQTIVIRCK